MKNITIEVPEGYEAVYSEDGLTVTFKPVEKDIWDIQDGDTHWHVNGRGDPHLIICGGMFYKERKDFYNMFPTKAIAETAEEQMLRCNAIITAGLRADPDAGSYIEGQRIHSARLEEAGWVAIGPRKINRHLPIYVHTKEQEQKMVELLNEWGVK